MTRELKPLTAGAAFDRIRIAREDTEEEAEAAKRVVLEKLPKRIEAIRARVTNERELDLLDDLLDKAPVNPL